MDRTRALDWFGWHRGTPVVGVHLSGRCVVVAAVRAFPLRLVGLGHEELPAAALADGDVRLAAPVAAAIGRLADLLNLDPASVAVITVEPLVDVLELGARPDRPGLASCPVRRATHVQAVDVMKISGLRLIRVDAVPASLARLRPLVGAGPAAISLGRWEIVADGEERAYRLGRATSGPALRARTPSGHPVPVTALTAVQVPRRLDRALDLDRHALAIGAALAGFGLPPLVPVRPLDPPHRSGGRPSWPQRTGSPSDHLKDRSLR